MQRNIPLHSLIFCPRDIYHRFPEHEQVTAERVCTQLIGGHRNHDLAAIGYKEMHHRLVLKLSLGERVVMDADDLAHRRLFAATANAQGAEVYHMTPERQDGLGEWIAPLTPIRAALPLPLDAESHLRAAGWQGITIIGDVHGELAPMKAALAWARSRRHFVWLLGDVIDYGEQTLATMECAYRAIMAGEAAMVLANHEQKIARWLNRDGGYIRLSEGNKTTTRAYEALSQKERARWSGRFRAMLGHTVLCQTLGDITLMHAAAHPSLWRRPETESIAQFAVHGESDHTGGRYRRTHRWVDAVPSGKLVIVGHDIVSSYPMVVAGTCGGRVVFLDTGCGKGGHLSSADLRFTDTTLRLECFKRY